MTDVEGPLVPAAPLSSLLAIRDAGCIPDAGRIRAAKASAGAAMMDGSLKADCNMAQAFENPHGKPGHGTAPPELTPAGANIESSRARLSGSPFPVRHDPVMP